MQKTFLLLLLTLIPFLESLVSQTTILQSQPINEVVSLPLCDQLYEEMQLEGVIGYMAFRQALEGYEKIDAKRKEILTVIDFTKPSTDERLYVLDMRNKKMLFKSVVSHGRNSGENYATSFSNKVGSYQSSLGFYLTDITYQGKNGYSLILDGLEKGINDRARERAIVMHGASYADPKIISHGGRLGRSLGCPAIPLMITKPIINTLKGGSVLYIYANNQDYIVHSTLLTQTKNGILSMN